MLAHQSDGALPMKPATRGFTLIEVAVVILVITLLIGSLLVPLTAQVEQRKVAETQKSLDEIREALIGYAMVNGRLPRPATSPTNGAENGALCASEADCTGFLPWVALGTAGTDAWGRLFRYSVTPAYANAVFSMTTPATKNVTNFASQVPAVVISSGANRPQFDETGAAIADDGSTTNVDEGTNATATTTFISRPRSEVTTSAGGEFDDIVVWVPTGILLNRMVAAGKLP